MVGLRRRDDGHRVQSLTGEQGGDLGVRTGAHPGREGVGGESGRPHRGERGQEQRTKGEGRCDLNLRGVAHRLEGRWTSLIPVGSAAVIVGFGLFFATRGGVAWVTNCVASSTPVPNGVGTVKRNGTRTRVPAIGANHASILRWAARCLITARSGM